MVLLNLSETAIRKRWTEHDKNKTRKKNKGFFPELLLLKCRTMTHWRRKNTKLKKKKKVLKDNPILKVN